VLFLLLDPFALVKVKNLNRITKKALKVISVDSYLRFIKQEGAEQSMLQRFLSRLAIHERYSNQTADCDSLRNRFKQIELTLSARGFQAWYLEEPKPHEWLLDNYQSWVDVRLYAKTRVTYEDTDLVTNFEFWPLPLAMLLSPNHSDRSKI
jgi:hypothetical protein